MELKKKNIPNLNLHHVRLKDSTAWPTPLQTEKKTKTKKKTTKLCGSEYRSKVSV